MFNEVLLVHNWKRQRQDLD